MGPEKRMSCIDVISIRNKSMSIWISCTSVQCLKKLPSIPIPRDIYTKPVNSEEKLLIVIIIWSAYLKTIRHFYHDLRTFIIILSDSSTHVILNVSLIELSEMKNRSRYEVIAAILKSANKEETRTKIMYKAMLSNDQCKIYLDSLLQSGLIQEVDNGAKIVYRTSSKGDKFLSYYDQMKELLPVGIEDNLTEEYYRLSV